MKANGEFVEAAFGSDFMFSLTMEKVVLTPGEYVFMIDPIWNSSAQLDGRYRDVLIDIYAPDVIDSISPIEDL